MGGGTPSRKNEEYWNGNIPWISVKDFKSNTITDSLETITQKGLENSTTKLIPKGNVIIPTRMALGKVAINKVDTAINQDLKALIIKDPKLLDLKYLMYFLQSKSDYIESNGKGATVKGVTIDTIANLDIKLPPIEVQTKIVSALDLSQSLIEKRKSQISALYKLSESVFLDMFGDPRDNKKWDEVQLSEIIEVESKVVKIDSGYDNYNLVGIDNIEKVTGKIINVKTVADSKVRGSKYYFNSNHILYSKIRPYLNKVALPGFEGLCSTDAYPLKIRPGKANKNFIAFILRYDAFVQYAVSHSKGANIPRIDKRQLLNYLTIYPNLRLQNEFGEKYNLIQNQIKLLEESINKFENNFNSILVEAFKENLFNY